MADHSAALPTDIDALHALVTSVLAERDAAIAERDVLAARNAKLEHLIREIRRAHFGRKSERIDDDQLALALEELETATAKEEAKDEKANPELKQKRARARRASRALNFDHLPHEEVVIESESKSCPCCGGTLHVIGEDTSRRLDKIPAKVRVIVTRRPKYACRKCTDGVVQAPAPPRLIEGGLPTEALVADVVVSKFADHLPLYRQAQILARHGVRIERSTLAQWVGAATAATVPVAKTSTSPPCPVPITARSRAWQDQVRVPVGDRA